MTQSPWPLGIPLNLPSLRALALTRHRLVLVPADRVWLGALALSLVALSWPAKAARAAWPQLLAAFEQRGFAVSVSAPPGSSRPTRSSEAQSSSPLSSTSHPRCAEPNLFGLYLRSRQLIVICPRGNQIQTLLHEGWHAVQHRCLQGAPLLSPEQLLRGLSRRERREVDTLYRRSSWQRQAEARVMAQQRPEL